MFGYLMPSSSLTRIVVGSILLSVLIPASCTPGWGRVCVCGGSSRCSLESLVSC